MPVTGTESLFCYICPFSTTHREIRFSHRSETEIDCAFSCVMIACTTVSVMSSAVWYCLHHPSGGGETQNSLCEMRKIKERMDSSVDVNLQIITVIIIICIPANVEYLCISVDIPAENQLQRRVPQRLLFRTFLVRTQLLYLSEEPKARFNRLI